MKGTGVVVSLEGDKARVKVTSGDVCQGCAQREHCIGEKPHDSEIIVINDFGARISDYIIFEANTGKVILSAVLVWILPILFMIVGYIISASFFTGFWPIGVSFLFLAGSFLFLKLINTAVSGGKTFYPRVTKILDASNKGKNFIKDFG